LEDGRNNESNPHPFISQSLDQFLDKDISNLLKHKTPDEMLEYWKIGRLGSNDK
jgi:hypothetical protein